MPVTTDPLTMSQAPSKEYLQGWNDCHKHMAEEIVRQDTQIEQYDLTIRGMTEKNDELREAGRKSADDAASALDLLSRIRFALGDNGTRMQDELLEYCRELRDAMVLAKKGADDAAYFERLYKSADEAHSYMVGQNNSLTRRVAELEAQLGLVSDEVLDELGRYRAALETISDPSTASMTHAGTVDTLRSHARRALKP